MGNGEEKTTFGSTLREKRMEKGWSQYYLASRAGCTNSNISYLENHPNQKPKIETVEALSAALGWPINEARRLAGYPESDDNLSPLEAEDDFRLALYGYKHLSERGQEMVKKQIGAIIDFVGQCEKDAAGPRSEREAGRVRVPEMMLKDVGNQSGGGGKRGRKKK